MTRYTLCGKNKAVLHFTMCIAYIDFIYAEPSANNFVIVGLFCMIIVNRFWQL